MGNPRTPAERPSVQRVDNIVTHAYRDFLQRGCLQRGCLPDGWRLAGCLPDDWRLVGSAGCLLAG
jgi:hypothetical protein